MILRTRPLRDSQSFVWVVMCIYPINGGRITSSTIQRFRTAKPINLQLTRRAIDPRQDERGSCVVGHCPGMLAACGGEPDATSGHLATDAGVARNNMATAAIVSQCFRVTFRLRAHTSPRLCARQAKTAAAPLAGDWPVRIETNGCCGFGRWRRFFTSHPKLL